MAAIFHNGGLVRLLRRLAPAGLILLAVLAAGGAILLPWESFGAPLLVILAAGGIASALIRFDAPKEERPFVLRLVLATFGVHLFAAVVFRLLIHGPLLDDAIGYDKAGAVLAGLGGQNLPVVTLLGPMPWLADSFFPRLIGVLYGFLGRSPDAIVALNIVLGVVSVYLTYRIAAVLLGPATARWAGWLAVLYSGFWLFSLMGLKDALGIFLLLLFFTLLYRLWNRLLLPEHGWKQIPVVLTYAACLAVVIWAAGEVREYVKPVLLLSTASLVFVWSGRFQRRWVTLVLLAIVLAAGILLWPRAAAYPLTPVNLTPDSGLGQAVQIPPTDTIGTLAGWILENPAAFGKYILLAAGSTILAPYGWMLPIGLAESPGFTPYTVALPGMWLWYACLPFCLMGAVSAWRRSKGEILPLMLFAVCLFLLFSLIIPRESRHRDILMPILLILSAEGWVYCRSRWLLGLAVWLPLSLFAAWHLHALGWYALAVTVAAALLAAWFILRAGGKPAGRTRNG